MKQDRITERDRKLLETLSDFGLMTTGQMERKIFAGIRSTTALRRLRILEKRKLLIRSSGLAKGRLAWSITAKGGGFIGRPDGFGHVNRNTLEHDALLSEIRLILEEIGASRGWKSGHSLKREVSPKRGESGLLPDGILFLPSGDSVNAVAIELELSAKAQGRYRSVLDEYDDKKSMCVWYIVSHPSIAKMVMKAFDSVDSYDRKGDWVYWTPLSEILGDPLQIRLRSKKKTLWLKDIAPIQITPKTVFAPAQGVAQEVSTPVDPAKTSTPSKSMNEQEMSRAPPNLDCAFRP